MKTKTCIATIAGIALFCWCTKVDAIEIKGTVRSATAENAIIVTEGEFLPSVGDTFEVDDLAKLEARGVGRLQNHRLRRLGVDLERCADC